MTVTNRPWFAIAMCALLMVPFLVVTIPPLSDVPGHMGSAAVAAYADHDAAFGSLMAFRWRPIPNLGADIIVYGLGKLTGITRAYWLIAIVIPPLIGAGIFMVARALNARGSAAIGWALVFVYSYPLSYGFINYMLGIGLSLIGFAAWTMLDRKPRLRAAAMCAVLPILFICHVVAACFLVLLVESREAVAWHDGERSIRVLLSRIWPLSLLPILIAAWRIGAHSIAGRNLFALKPKLNALVMILRDQNLALDIGSLALAIVIFGIGWWNGARPHRAVGPAIIVLILVFLAIPPSFSGSDFADMRLLPLIPMLALATQDWNKVRPRLARFTTASGVMLLIVRLGFTTAGFVAYDASYQHELAALDAIPAHGRILVLNTRSCNALRDWRATRLNHIGDLAIVYRRSWTNSQWDIDGGQLVDVRYRPSPEFYHDPSQYVWPAECGGPSAGRPTVADALSRIPFGRIDYLWLIDTPIPPGYHDPRLSLRWRSGTSSLYAVNQKVRVMSPVKARPV